MSFSKIMSNYFLEIKWSFHKILSRNFFFDGTLMVIIIRFLNHFNVNILKNNILNSNKCNSFTFLYKKCIKHPVFRLTHISHKKSAIYCPSKMPHKHMDAVIFLALHKRRKHTCRHKKQSYLSSFANIYNFQLLHVWRQLS